MDYEARCRAEAVFWKVVTMLSPHRRLATAASAVLMGAGALVAAMGVAAAPATADSCQMYIQPFNPFLQTCGIPNDPPVVRGASPGAGAIIACRNIPRCLSYVVNGGPGYGGVTRPDTRVRQSQ
jgi:hypothetical protein